MCGILLAAGAAPAGKVLTLEGYLRKMGYGVIPLERGSQNNLYIKAKLDGKSRTFLVDTGCSVTTLDKGTAGKLKTAKELGVAFEDPMFEWGEDAGSKQSSPQGNEVEPAGDRAKREEGWVIMPELRLGTVRFLNQPARTFALKAQGFSYDGILGCDFLFRNHAIVDCAAKRLYISGNKLGKEYEDALAKTLGASGYHPAQLKRSEALLLTCEGRINEVPVKLAVDTGAVYTMLDDDTANRCKIVWQQTGRYLEGVTKGTLATLWSGAPDSFELGGARVPVEGMSIGACELQAWKVGGSKAKLLVANGLLGGELLSRCEAVIDFGSQTLWFVPAGEAPVKKRVQ